MFRLLLVCIAFAIGVKDESDTCQCQMDRWAHGDSINLEIGSYVDCLGTASLNSDGALVLNSTEVDGMLQHLIDNDICELSMTDTCHCEFTYVTAKGDPCMAAKQFYECSMNSFMAGCSYSNRYLEGVRSLARSLQKQNCPHDPEIQCPQTIYCSLDMAALGTATRDESCSNTQLFQECLEAKTPCDAINATLDYVKELKNSLGCWGQDEPPSTSQPTLPLTTPFPTYLTTPQSGNPATTCSGLSFESKVLLKAQLDDVDEEVLETIHAAEEVQEAINTARSML